MNFYLTLNGKGQVGYLPFEELENMPGDIRYMLSCPLPLTAIKVIEDRLGKRKALTAWAKGLQDNSVNKKILAVIKGLGWDLPPLEWREISNYSDVRKRTRTIDRGNIEIEQAFNKFVLGRQLSAADFQELSHELKTEKQTLVKLAHANVELGYAQWVPSVSRHGQGWQCQRCGEREVEEWPSLYGNAATCRSCESIGATTSLEVLYRDQRLLVDEASEVIFQPHWNLTEAQKSASDQVLNFIQDPLSKKALLWAACGAGKTEVCFPSAAWALKQGKTVLFAAPRQDVIHDVAPRIVRDFPGQPCQVLSGRALMKFQSGPMVLATTHQVLKFWRAFDVIFLDEMDAFPYRGNSALEWGLKNALREGGKILYLTATPSEEGLKAVQNGTMQLIRLPARHHRCALPVPKWERTCHSLVPDQNTDVWASQAELLRKDGPVLVFVPKISWIDPWVKSFQQRFPNWCVDGSYSADHHRSTKIEKLQQGKYDLFVSTTILERGITLSGIQVIVLAADHPLYDERALVQMAGRVGRTKECPQGNVIFISKRKTSSMATAIQWIKEQNRLALALGLIDG